LKRRLAAGHLRSCARCRAFALDLAEFSHGMEPPKGAARLLATERDELHRVLMAAFHRERQDERAVAPFQRAAGPAIRPSFIRAMASLALILGLALVLSTPFIQEKTGGADAQIEASRLKQALDELDPTPSPTPEIPKTENK
jgi:hypothetical protein